MELDEAEDTVEVETTRYGFEAFLESSSTLYTTDNRRKPKKRRNLKHLVHSSNHAQLKTWLNSNKKSIQQLSADRLVDLAMDQSKEAVDWVSASKLACKVAYSFVTHFDVFYY